MGDPRMGTLVVASAGADAQAQQVISQRDRTDKGVVFLWTGSRDATAGLVMLQRPDTDFLHAGHIGPRPAEPLGVSYMARAPPGRWLCHGPVARGAAGCGHRSGSWLGASDTLRSESKQLLAAWGVGSAREHLATSRPPSRPQSSLGFVWLSRPISPDIPHKTEAGVVRLNLGDAAQRVNGLYAEILANAKAYAPQAQIIGVSVQEMVGEGVEVIIGVSCDPHWARCSCSAVAA